MRGFRGTCVWLAVVLATVGLIVLAVNLTSVPSNDADEQAEALSTETAEDSGGVSDDSGVDEGANTTSAEDNQIADDFAYVGSGEDGSDDAAGDEQAPVVSDDDLADHEDGVVLVSVPAGTTRDELQIMLADADYVDASKVTDDELARGLVTLHIADDTSVADASAQLSSLPGIEGAQPNYIYTLADSGASSLGETLAAASQTGGLQAGSTASTDGVEAESATGGSDGQSAEAGSDEAADADAELTDGSAAASGDSSDVADTPDSPDASVGSSSQEDTPPETLPQELGLESVSINDPKVTETGAWGLESLRAYDAWETVKCAVGTPVAGTTVGVAVLDTGCDTGHEDLKNNILASYDASGRNSVADFVGHGTHVAGIISAQANNGVGTAGVSYNAGLVIVKASTGDGKSFDTKTLTTAYDWVISHAKQYNIRVINLSVGGSAGTNPDTALLKRIDTAYAQGILTVAAAGNSESNLVVPYECYPGDHETVLSVMNLQHSTDTTSDAFANATNGVSLNRSSNYNVSGPVKDVCAPGTSILSTYSDDTKGGLYNGNDLYQSLSGTSMASPYVAGVAALVFTANPHLTAQQAMNVIENTATDLGATGWDRYYGYGEVDAAAAVQNARAGTGTQAPQTTLSAINPQISGLQTVSVTSGTASYTLTVSDSETSWSSFKSLTWTWSSSNESVGTISATTTAGEAATMTIKGIGTTTLTATCVADPSITASYTVKVENVAMSGASVSIAAQTYTGSALTPSPTVTYDGTTLRAGTDYTVEYANNINAGTAQMTIVGKGSYAGTITKNFTINPAPLSSASVTLSPSSYVYDGSEHKPSVTATYNGLTLANSASGDYTKSYEKGESATTVGTHTVTLTAAGSGNFTGTTTATYTITRPSVSVSYCTHVQNIGWQSWKTNGAVAGTSGQSLRLEAIYLNLDGASSSLGTIQYRTHVQNIGWQDWKSAGQMSGTSGQALRLEAIQIRLTGNLAKIYDVYYRVHAQNIGWMDWACNGASAGTSGLSYRLEAIQVVLVPKGSAAPGATTTPYRSLHYRTHVQNDGWQDYTYEGTTAGTSGRSLRLEGINIALGDQYAQQGVSGGIRYRTHVQNIGWQGWRYDGAMAGTSGRSLRLEAIRIELTGEMASKYDVYYRVHAQNIGWMGWAKNGASAGTAGYAYRLEAIQIRIVPKGGAAPGSTSDAFRQR